MLKFPDRLTISDTNKIIDTISYIAQNPEILEINENTSAEDIQFVNYLKNLLASCNIYQYELPELPHGKIILSNEVYNKLYSYACDSNKRDSKMTEFGGYLYGREIAPNVVCFHRNNIVKMKSGSGDIETPEKLCEEIVDIIEKTDCDCIAHIHTHPYRDGYYSLFPSNQDLYTYAYLQEQFNQTGNEAFFLGGLITPLTKPGAYVRLNDLCFMYYDRNAKRFYKCDNIFYKDEYGNENPLPKITYVSNDEETGKVLLKEKRTLIQNPNNI